MVVSSSKVRNHHNVLKILVFFISFLRPHSPHMDPAEAQQLRRLRERIALLSADRPFQNLEVIATLGMGGFGRVELVSFNYTLKFLPRLESHVKPLHPARAGQKEM